MRKYKESYMNIEDIPSEVTGYQASISFFVNPSLKELNYILDSYQNIARGILLNDGRIIAWDGRMPHFDTIKNSKTLKKFHLIGDPLRGNIRNYVKIKIRKDGSFYLSDDESIDSILENPSFNKDVLVNNPKFKPNLFSEPGYYLGVKNLIQ